MEKDIKDYRGKELKSYVIANFLAILYGTGFLYKIAELIGGNRDLSLIASSATFAVLTAVIYIFVFLADALVPSEVKDAIVWFRCGRPGERIFTEIRDDNKDKRFSTQDALVFYADIYESIDIESNEEKKKVIQNKNWYYLYKLHEKKTQIFVSQRDSLLCRDINVITIMLFLGFIVLYFLSNNPFSCYTLLFFFIEFVLTRFLAQTKGNRYAYNVIATDIAAKKADNNAKRIKVDEENIEYYVIVQRKNES